MSEPHTLLTGFVFGESPRWHDGRLWFADWGTQQIVAVDLDGKREDAVRVPAFPFCFDWLPDGRLLIVSGQDGQLLRREPDGSLVTHADLSGLADPPWNDIVVDGRGNAYVNSIGFEFPGGEFRPGAVVLVTPDGAARRVADGMAFPNGMAVTPDNSTLIVAESFANRLTAFDIDGDGGLTNRRVWADLGQGAPDGVCLDADDAVWYADVPNKRCVRVREGSRSGPAELRPGGPGTPGGDVLQTIELDRGCFACTLGGPDRRTLFLVTADWTDPAAMMSGPPTGQLLTVAAPAPGVGWP